MGAGREIRLDVVAEVREYQKKMAQIPGITDKQAARAALKFERRFVKAQDEAAKAAAAAGKEAASNFGDAFAGITIAITPSDILAGATALKTFGDSVAAGRQELLDMERETGVARDTLAGLRLAAQSSGRDFESMREVLNPLNALMSQVAQGSENARDRLAAVGIEAVDPLTGKLKSNDAVLRELIVNLDRMEDGSDRARAAVSVLGESGGKLLDIVGDSDSLEAFVAQAELLGETAGPDAERATREWTQATASLQAVISGTAGDLFDFLDVTPKIRAVTLGFVFVKEAAVEFFENAIAGATVFGEVVTNAFQGVVMSSGEIRDRLEELGADSFEGIEKKAFDAAQEFFNNEQAIRAAADASGDLTFGLGEQEDAQEGATEATRRNTAATREAIKAERERVKVIEEQFGALQELVAAGNEAAEEGASDREKLINAYGEEISRLEDLRNEAGNTAMAREAFDRAVEQSRARLNSELEALDIEQLEGSLESIDLELEAFLESEEAKREARKATDEAIVRGARMGLDLFQEANGIILDLTRDRIATLDGELEASRQREEASIADLRAQREDATKAERSSINAQIRLKRAQGKAEREQIQKTLRRQKIAATIAFRANQAAGVADAVIKGAQASLALALPPPVGLGPIAGPAFAAVSTGVAIGSILAQPPPKFHDGTGRDGARGPDEFLATLRTGEGVANSRSMGIPGFPEFLQATNQLGAAAMGIPSTIRAVISQTDVERSVERGARGDGRLGALLTDSAPGASMGYT